VELLDCCVGDEYCCFECVCYLVVDVLGDCC